VHKELHSNLAKPMLAKAARTTKFSKERRAFLIREACIVFFISSSFLSRAAAREQSAQV
jgi:hypothetical protein